jgi:hypothetical protein
MRVFMTKVFREFQRKEGITDGALCEAVERAELGLIDAKLTKGLIKQRVARPSAGRRGGFRTIIAYRQGTRAVFLSGFAKNERENISAEEEGLLADVGARLIDLGDKNIAQYLKDKTLWEIDCDG